MGLSYAQLNSKQKQAVDHLHGPMLVLAGAGTGKTSVLAHRIARLIREKHAAPGEIVAFTFTHKAAQEIRSRVIQTLQAKSALGLHASTFHGYCYGLLKNRGADFELLDSNELWAYLRQRIRELPLARFLKPADPGRFLHDLLNFFDRCTDELVTAADYARYVAELREGKHPLPRVSSSKQREQLAAADVIERCEEISSVFSAMTTMLERERLLTFGSLVTQAVALLRREPALLAREQQRARFILIDEFQDSNHAQIELTRLLAGEEQNVFAVGDPDQAIYHFRGASSASFNEFASSFDPLQQSCIVNLAENQRSTQHILDCAYSAIRHNDPPAQQGNVHFTRERLISSRDRRSEPDDFLFALNPVFAVLYRERQQDAVDIAESLLDLHAQGTAWSDCAVLYRSHSAVDDIVQELGGRGIPFEVQGTDLFNTGALRDVLSWLYCTISLQDDISLFRLALRTEAKVDLLDLQAKLANAERGTRLVTLLETCSGGAELVAVLRGFSEQHVAILSLSRVIDDAARELGIDALAPELVRFRDFAERWSEKKISGQKTLREFLEFVELYRESGGILELQSPERPEDEFAFLHGRRPITPEPQRDAVRLMTIHAAKGLEFDHVSILRMAQGSFPGLYREVLFEFPRELRRSLSQITADDSDLHAQEERRLCYVAMTRARDTLTLYGKPRSNATYPTPFIKEIADDKSLAGIFATRAPRPRTQELEEAELPHWMKLDLPIFNGPIELSPSAIETFANCPLKFWLGRGWRLPEEPSAALQYGSAIHTALRDFFDAAKRGVRRSAEETIAIFREAFSASVVPEQLQRDLYEEQGAEQLRQFVASQTGDPPPVLATEKSFRIALAEGIAVRGRIDRIDRVADGLVRIVDYKTGRPKKSDDARMSIQLSIYAWAMEKLERWRTERVVFHNIEDNTLVEATRSPRQLAEAEETVLEVADALHQRRFEPKTGMACRSCRFSVVCPATAERIFTSEQAHATAGVP
ncbi:MAG TPA: ATP-dependent DNA helicase [Terriglobales bacterium]|nr:ATP-dependent DNA helicase [Terriglobales bacterium]